MKLNYKSKIVGVTFEGRQEVIKELTKDSIIRVRREPDNEFDAKAVAVDALIKEHYPGVADSDGEWLPIGYIAADKNKDIAESIDAGKEVMIRIASLTGGDRDKKGKVKSYGVNIELDYEKVEKPVEVGEQPANYKSMLHDALVGLGVIEPPTVEKYRSRVLGRIVQVVKNGGHISIPGFMSGSKFPERFYQPFPDDIKKKMAEKFDVEESDIQAMWDLQGEASTSFGTSIHAAMENYDKHRKLGDKMKEVKKYKTKPTYYGPNKALSKNPFLKKLVEDFHELFGGDYIRLNEEFIWDIDEGLCGSIDRIKVIDADKRIIRIQDFKTDGDVHEKKYQLTTSPFKGEVADTLLGYHWFQLSFYAYILKKYGYTVEGLDVYWVNPEKLVKGENPWEEYSHDVIDITGVIND